MRILGTERRSMRALRLGWPGLFVLMALGGNAAARGREHAKAEVPALAASAPVSPDTLRLPYNRGKVYQVRLLPGAPFALELPVGESVKNLWFDNRWWAAETTPGASRVFLRAIGASDVVGRTGFIHIETDPSDLRLSVRVEAVHDSAAIPAALEIYVEGSALNDPAQRQMRKSIDRELVYAQKQAQDNARSQFDAWRKNAMVNLRGDEAIRPWWGFSDQPRGGRSRADLHLGSERDRQCGDPIHRQDWAGRTGQLRDRERNVRGSEQGPAAG